MEWTYIIPVATGIAGYLLSWFKERYQSRNQLAREQLVEHIKEQLQQLIWPLFFRLTELLCDKDSQTVDSLKEWHNGFHQILSSNLYLSGEERTVRLIMNYSAMYSRWIHSESPSPDTFPYEDLEELADRLMTKIYTKQKQYTELMTEQWIPSVFMCWTCKPQKHDIIANAVVSRRLDIEDPFISIRTQMSNSGSRIIINNPKHSIQSLSPTSSVLPNPYVGEDHQLDSLQRLETV